MTLENVKKTVAETLEVDPSVLLSTTELDKLEGFDSIKILSLMVALDDLGISVSQEIAANLKTYGDIEKMVRMKLGNEC